MLAFSLSFQFTVFGTRKSANANTKWRILFSLLQFRLFVLCFLLVRGWLLWDGSPPPPPPPRYSRCNPRRSRRIIKPSKEKHKSGAYLAEEERRNAERRRLREGVDERRMARMARKGMRREREAERREQELDMLMWGMRGWEKYQKKWGLIG